MMPEIISYFIPFVFSVVVVLPCSIPALVFFLTAVICFFYYSLIYFFKDKTDRTKTLGNTTNYNTTQHNVPVQKQYINININITVLSKSNQ
mmetsp:Transcript_8781/g.12761  ORF Transcript_8781/g.12761 Transcript_8781/m.12761 type:complete len:91 (-) Transcript_8781:610-882(-)